MKNYKTKIFKINECTSICVFREDSWDCQRYETGATKGKWEYVILRRWNFGFDFSQWDWWSEKKSY